MKYRILLPVAVASGYFFLHLRWMTRIVGWDALTYADNVNTGLWARVLYNPHHLGFEFAGLVWWKFLSFFWTNPPLYFSLQLWMLACAALFPVIFAWLFARIYNDLTGAVVVSLVMISSEAYLFYAQTFDTAVQHAALQCLLFLLCADGVRRGFTRISVIGIFVVQFLTIFFHQSDVLFVLMFPAAWVMSVMRKRRTGIPPAPAAGNAKSMDRPRNLFWVPLAYLTTLGVSVAVGYLWTGFVILKRDLASSDGFHFTRWLLMYAIAGKWGLPVGWTKRIEWGWHGIGDAFYAYEGRTDRFRIDFGHFTDPAAFPYNAVAAFFLIVIVVGLFTAPRQIRKFGAEYVLFALWLGPTVAFFSWWEGYYFEYWLGLVLGLWLFSYFVLKGAVGQVLESTGKAILSIVYALLTIALAATNFRLSMEPRSRMDYFPEKHFGDKTIERIKRERPYR